MKTSNLFKRTRLQHVTSTSGATVSFDRYGSGPPLVLVHGSFTTHETNWEFVKPMLAKQFTVYAIARRGRGETDATQSHSVIDEAADVATVLKTLDEPAFLLGHSYGAHVALAAALEQENRIAKLILYEPHRPDLPVPEELNRLEELAGAGQWDRFAVIPNARVDELTGQAHEGMTTAPEQYTASVSRFLLTQT